MMDAMYINSKPHVLLSTDTTQRPAGNGERTDRRRAASDAGLASSGSAAAKPPHPPFLTSSSLSHAVQPRPSSARAFSSSPAAPIVSHTAILPSLSSLGLPPAESSAGPGRSAPVPLSFPSTRSGIDELARTARSGNFGAADNGSSSHSNDFAAADSHAFIPPLYFNPGANTTPETSLVGARGESIPLDDSTAAHRTSALRELNSNFPSPVLRHRYAKSAGAKNSTYSQPVIVRTYSGPSPSPSSSAHRPRPSSSYRAGSRTAGSRRIPLPPSTPPPAEGSAAAAASSDNAPGTSKNSSKEGLFSMARSRVKKTLIPWQWVTGESEAKAGDDTRLPPLEAFTFKGFMADLQTTTDIRADLDRIAEICARSRYSLSNQYDSHVAPHGSGAGFINGGGPPPYRSKGRKKGGAGVGGPTLQAVPSDDDESSNRGQRRRRGGVGGGRRRSVAYGTLETIMSSSRSSEEDKTKKKSAAEIAAEVRGRAAQKAADVATSKAGSGSGSGSGSRGSRNGETKSKKSSQSPPAADSTGDQQALADDGASVGAASRHSNRLNQERRKSTSFAHAVIDRNRHHQSQSSGASLSGVSATIPTPSTAALLSGPALPQTSDNLFEIHSATNGTTPHNHVTDDTAKNPSVHEQSPTGSSMNGTEPSTLDAGLPTAGREHFSAMTSPEDVAAAGFLSGLSSWIPWVSAAGTGDGAGANQKTTSAGPSHAEGSLRELLKTVEASKPNKGKAVDHGY